MIPCKIPSKSKTARRLRLRVEEGTSKMRHMSLLVTATTGTVTGALVCWEVNTVHTRNQRLASSRRRSVAYPSTSESDPKTSDCLQLEYSGCHTVPQRISCGPITTHQSEIQLDHNPRSMDSSMIHHASMSLDGGSQVFCVGSKMFKVSLFLISVNFCHAYTSIANLRNIWFTAQIPRALLAMQSEVFSDMMRIGAASDDPITLQDSEEAFTSFCDAIMT